VLARLLGRYRALVPVRFGAALGRDDIRPMLDRRAPALERALRTVDGRVQMTIRMRDVPTAPPRHAESPPGSASGPASRRSARGAGATYLIERAAATARAERVRALEPLRPAVRRWVRGEQVERRGEAVAIHHLVPRSAAAAYRRALVRAAARHAIELEVRGPMPAYAFVGGE
jgi:hypothetical protein